MLLFFFELFDELFKHALQKLDLPKPTMSVDVAGAVTTASPAASWVVAGWATPKSTETPITVTLQWTAIIWSNNQLIYHTQSDKILMSQKAIKLLYINYISELIVEIASRSAPWLSHGMYDMYGSNTFTNVPRHSQRSAKLTEKNGHTKPNGVFE